MTQEIIVYIIVAVAAIIFTYKIYKSVTRKGGACDSCPSDCTCELKESVDKKKARQKK